ncbi:MAG: ferrous iron transport protein A [Bacteroidetes bacterium]|nr:ferrous iron transport protein A [Bacteroidota bacterium]MCH8942625.1 ferrous iron transport protein A [Bacteroidota bacterium]
MKTAAELKCGEKVTINDINIQHPSAKRLLEVGFTPGQEIELVNKSVFNDPIAISLRGTVIALRKSDADCIIIS